MSFDMKDIVIEQGSVQDAEELAILEKVGFPGDEGASLETVRKRLTDFGDWFLVARYQGRIIGFVNGALSEKEVITDEMYLADYDPPQEANNLMIFSLVTDPAYRSQGLAARMLTALLEVAREKGVDKAALTCREYLIHYYESFGFTNLGVSESVLGDKVWYDLVLDIS